MDSGPDYAIGDGIVVLHHRNRMAGNSQADDAPVGQYLCEPVLVALQQQFRQFPSGVDSRGCGCDMVLG
jgi:hypothetical protein